MDTEVHRRSLQDFRTKIWDEVALNVATNLTVDREEFLNYVTGHLIDAEEIEDFYYVPYEGFGRRNRRIQIDGYAYSELEECLSIFIATPMTYEENETLIATEANRYIAMAAAFLENAEYIVGNAEESSPGYGFAVDILGLYSDVRKYKIFLISDKVKSKALTKLENLQVRGKTVECHVWDIERIFGLSTSSMGREEIVIKFSEFGIKGLPCLLASDTSDYKAYLCNIPGIVLATLYNRYGGRLLEGNVRSFLQVRGKVNKGIRYTILNEPEMFFAYNNGIAATAYDIEVDTFDGIPYITEISSLQIVNGGQTTASLATALVKDKKDHAEENIRRIHIPMKLSIVLPEKADKLIGNIARYANSQNKVSDADLWSNHPYHIRMEEFSRRIIAPATNGRQYGTYWYYERANGQYAQETYKATQKEKERFLEQHPKTQKITKTEFAKYMHVCQQRPDIASLGGQKAFGKFAETVSACWEKDNTIYNEEYFKNSISVALLFRESDKIVRKQDWYKSYKANIVAYALSKIFYTIDEQYKEYTVNLKAIWQKQMLSNAWIKQIEDASWVMYQYLIKDDRGVENVTEWAKREACWKGAKALEYHLLPEFIAELQSKDVAKNDAKDAKKAQKLADKLNALVEVVSYGSENWAKLLEWNASHRIMAPSEIHQIQLAKTMDGGLIASEKKCQKVLKILEKCRVEGFPG